MSTSPSCAGCPAKGGGALRRLGLRPGAWDFVVALAGNPNTGKSTLFNALTGLRQHTGNWPGKTVTRASGGFAFGGHRYRLVDLPGTYSLLSTSVDEEIARDYILFGRPDVIVVVVDATRLERNLNLALQVLQITDRAVVCLNLMDEARRLGMRVDARKLARALGVPVIPTAARHGAGLDALLTAIAEVAQGNLRGHPPHLTSASPAVERVVEALARRVRADFPTLSNARWVALRLLDGDPAVVEAVRSGALAQQATEGMS